MRRSEGEGIKKGIKVEIRCVDARDAEEGQKKSSSSSQRKKKG